jgi:hypothetical protein
MAQSIDGKHLVNQRRDLVGLSHLLERISRTEGQINPQDRAVARIFAGALRQQPLRASDTEKGASL